MIKKKISDFLLSVGEYVDIAVSVPTSVIDAFRREKIIPDPYYLDNCKIANELAKTGARFTAKFMVDGVMLGKRYIYLSLDASSAPLTVFVNESPVAKLTNPGVSYTLDMRQYILYGENTLTLDFEPREPLTYLSDISLAISPELIAYDRAAIENVVIKQNIGEESATLEIDVETLGNSQNIRTVATLISRTGSVSYAGLPGGHGRINVKVPNLWQPDPALRSGLYRMNVNLYYDNEVIDYKETMVGIRKVEYKDEKLYINERHVFVVGATYSMDEIIRPDMTADKMRKLLLRTKAAGINTIYLRGTKTLVPDSFISLCDECGIMLWFDIPDNFNLSYPAGVKIAESELRRMFKGLSHHPSIVFIIGGGETGGLVEKLVGELVPGAIYLPSLPISVTPGVPTLPSYNSVLSFLPKEEHNILAQSLTERCRGNMLEFFSHIMDKYKMPHAFSDFIYLGGLISAETIEDAVIAARLGGSDFGVIFDTLTDPYPAPSASVFDFDARPKALWYRASRFTENVIVKAVVDGTRVKFYCSNLQTKVYIGRLIYSVKDNINEEIIRDSVPIEVPPDTTKMVLECNLSGAISGRESECYLAYRIADTAGMTREESAHFVLQRTFKFKKPTFATEIVGTDMDYTLTIASDVYAAGVAVDFGDEDVTLEDNYFDITSSAPLRIKVHAYRPTAQEALKHRLSVHSLYEVGNDAK